MSFNDINGNPILPGDTVRFPTNVPLSNQLEGTVLGFHQSKVLVATHHVVDTPPAWLSPLRVEVKKPMPVQDVGRWYAAERHSETFHIGPHATIEDAVVESVENEVGLYDLPDDPDHLTWRIELVLASNPPVRLADWVDADHILEYAEDVLCDSDRKSNDFDDGPCFEVKEHEERALQAYIRRAIDAWQADYNLIFGVQTFERIHNRVSVDLRLLGSIGEPNTLTRDQIIEEFNKQWKEQNNE